jgi:hypothetical protein
MVTKARPTVVIDVAAKWAVDAAFFLAMAVGFLLWGVIARSPTANILTFAIMATLAMLLDRMRPFLSDAAALAQAHEPPPADAVRRTWARYAAETVAAMGVLACIQVALVAALGIQPGFFAGWLTAYGVSRLRALATALELERTKGARLSARFQRSVWRARAPEYYATPRPA